jgi:hypothetical protein
VIENWAEAFYEAWQVVAGAVYGGSYVPGDNFPPTDTFSFPDQGDCTRGFVNVLASAQYVPGFDASNWPTGGQFGHQGLAGELPTLPYVQGQQPNGFAPTLAMAHELHLSWTCCPSHGTPEHFRTLPEFPDLIVG